MAAAAAFTTSAAAGLGGSLILVPALALTLGTKEGIALAALLLALNNVVKVFAYRRTIPLAGSTVVIGLTILGSATGAALLVAAPVNLVSIAIVMSIGLTLLAERIHRARLARRNAAPAFAFAAGATSGFSGTSGPLKGLAVRSLQRDRFHTAGAASAVSLAGDATKAAIFAEAALLNSEGLAIAALCVPLMFVATYAGWTANRALGERGYAILFWAVMCGYSLRLAVG